MYNCGLVTVKMGHQAATPGGSRPRRGGLPRGRAMAVLAMLILAAGSARAQRSELVTSFEDDLQMRLIVPRDTRYETIGEGATEGARAVRITFSTVKWPALFFRSETAWNLKPWGEIALDVTNPEDEQVTFSVRVDDDFRANGTLYCRTGSSSLAPHATQTFSFPLALSGGADYGMKGLPGWPATRSLGSNGSWQLDTSHIVQFQIFMNSPARERTLIVDNVRWREAPPMDQIVDAFGQFTGADWPGKLHSADEFTWRLEEENEQLTAAPSLPARDVYGGWGEGPRLEATGYFRTEKFMDRWWLVTPEGTLMFSTGVDGVRPYAPTYTKGREQMFTWLPQADDPLSAHSTPSTFDFHQANLQRKYGSDWLPAWREMTLRRLRSWGFNTIANWSDPLVYASGIPYVTTTHYSGGFAWIKAGSSGIGDPFDPLWEQAVRDALRRTVGASAGDAWVLGHFVDNELPWHSGPAEVVLGLSAAGSPAKRAFTEFLQARYGDAGALNQAWGTAFGGWESLGAPKTPRTAAAERDLSDLLRLLAQRYYSKVREMVKEIDPNHLYLGSRIHVYTPEVVEAAAEHCDVVSFNIYQRDLSAAVWQQFAGMDKPAIIGEFHFGALDRGMFHTGLQATASQEARALAFRKYMMSVLAHPSFVGAHWFLLYDQPLTGRTLDGENYNIGFLTVTDTPYPEMVGAARIFNDEMYWRRVIGAMDTGAMD